VTYLLAVFSYSIQKCIGVRFLEEKATGKSHIKAGRGEVSLHNTAKPSSPVAEVNAAVVPWSNAFLPGEIPRSKCLGKSAEAIVP
jgi:hypothetical protein